MLCIISIVPSTPNPDLFTNPVKDLGKKECRTVGKRFNRGPDHSLFHEKVPDLTYQGGTFRPSVSLSERVRGYNPEMSVKSQSTTVRPTDG